MLSSQGKYLPDGASPARSNAQLHERQTKGKLFLDTRENNWQGFSALST